MTRKERAEYQAQLTLEHWTARGKTLADLASGWKASRDAHNAAWLWLKRSKL